MRDQALQQALLEFLRREGVVKKLRFAGVLKNKHELDGLPAPSALFAGDGDIGNGSAIVLEIGVSTLADPKTVVMKYLQAYTSIVATRTYFCMNLPSQEAGEAKSKKGVLQLTKEWAGPLSHLRRLFLGA